MVKIARGGRFMSVTRTLAPLQLARMKAKRLAGLTISTPTVACCLP